MLIFSLKKEWYEKIKNGEKMIEYREVKPYWTSRIAHAIHKHYPNENEQYINFMTNVFSHTGCTINFPVGQCTLRFGYTNRYMTASITTIEIVNGKDTDLHIDKPVYAIHLTDVKEKSREV